MKRVIFIILILSFLSCNSKTDNVSVNQNANEQTVTDEGDVFLTKEYKSNSEQRFDSLVRAIRSEYNKSATQDIITFTWQIVEQKRDVKRIELEVTDCKMFIVNWGDGIVETETGKGDSLLFLDLWHTYAVTGEYMVTIVASSSDFRFTHIDFSREQLTGLDLSGCLALRSLNCTDNQLTTLNLSSCPTLEKVRCDNNQLTNIDLSSCPALMSLHCNNNQLTSLDLSRCPVLSFLCCDKNQLTRLDLSGCPALAVLHCYNNQLTSLDLSGCPALAVLHCYNNQLTRLDVNGCKELKNLDCDNNQLTNLDLNDCKKLTTLSCSNNQYQLSDLFAAHLLIKEPVYKKVLGTQNLPPQTIEIGEVLFSEQAVFDGIFTKYTITQNGKPAPESDDYAVVDGKLKFNTVGEYTVTMTNKAIVSYMEYPAKVIVEITVVKSRAL